MESSCGRQAPDSGPTMLGPGASRPQDSCLQAQISWDPHRWEPLDADVGWDLWLKDSGVRDNVAYKPSS